MEDIRKIVRKNLLELTKRRNSLYKSANAISIATNKSIGQTTISNYMRESYIGYPKLDHLETIANLFGLQTWHLLLPNLDVENPPVILQSKAEQEFYSKMKEASKQLNKLQN
jgi:hypothetical protein